MSMRRENTDVAPVIDADAVQIERFCTGKRPENTSAIIVAGDEESGEG